jgi:hypothetical protein
MNDNNPVYLRVSSWLKTYDMDKYMEQCRMARTFLTQNGMDHMIKKHHMSPSAKLFVHYLDILS